MPKQQQPTQTIEITNFSGRLTRILNGDMNSGFANFANSWGYDPFSKPGNLTWNAQASSISGILSMPVAGIKDTNPFFHLLDSKGNYYWMKNSSSSNTNGVIHFNALDDAVVSILGTIPDTYVYGGNLENFSGDVYASGDNTIYDINGGIGSTTFTSVTGSASILSATPHPLKQFVGKLYFGNGNNIGEISSNIITTNAKLSPGLPSGMTVTDLDVTPEGDYLLITASFASPPYFGSASQLASSNTFQNYAAQSEIFYWNGSDVTATASRSLPSFPSPALSTFLDKQYTVMQDTFGMALMEGTQKLLTLPNNMNPTANALTPNGTFITWVSSEGTGAVNSSSTTYSSVFASLYYYGQLDQEVPPGLWRMNRISPISGNYTIQYTPFNDVINNYSFYGQEVYGFGKHFVGTQDAFANPPSYSSVVGRLHRFVLNPAANTSPVSGVYETQSQLFSKRATIKQIRVYTEPTVSGNGFQIDVIGSNGTVQTNGTFNYTFTAGSDITKVQGSLERIDFNPAMLDLFTVSLRVTNTGTTNMTIKKIEIDWAQSGK